MSDSYIDIGRLCKGIILLVFAALVFLFGNQPLAPLAYDLGCLGELLVDVFGVLAVYLAGSVLAIWGLILIGKSFER